MDSDLTVTNVQLTRKVKDSVRSSYDNIRHKYYSLKDSMIRKKYKIVAAHPAPIYAEVCLQHGSSGIAVACKSLQVRTRSYVAVFVRLTAM